MIVVDTSLLVSFLSPNDPHHQKSLAWFESVLEQDLISPTLALVELAATFARAGYSISSTQSLINKAKSIRKCTPKPLKSPGRSLPSFAFITSLRQ